MDLLSVMESLSSPKRRVWVMKGSLLAKIRFSKNIFDFVNESQSLIKEKFHRQVFIPSYLLKNTKKELKRMISS